MPTRTIRLRVRAAVGGALLSVACCAAASGATSPITVLTYNTDHGGRPNGTAGELNTIAAQNPDVVVLEEAGQSQLSTYVDGLNARFGTTAWHGVAARHCNVGTEPTCATYTDESAMVLTRLKTVSSASKLIWAKDDYHVARASVEMTVALADGTRVNVFVCHTPALSDAAAARTKYVALFQPWAATFPGPRLVGGDFNESYGSPSIVAMNQQFADAWGRIGIGNGYTHSHDGSTLTSRIDYWFSDLVSGAAPTTAHTAGSLADSDHISLTVTYAIPSNSTVITQSETTVFADDFSTFDKAAWAYALFTGSQDASVPLTVGGGFQVGPLPDGVSGSHYNGMSSAAYDISSNGSIEVQLVAAPNTMTTAYAMFAAGSDANNFYRWYESGNALVAERKVGGTKKTLVNLPYDAAAQQFLRIRREFNTATGTTDVVFETAPNNGGVAGAYTVRYREAWSASVAAGAMKCELKAGTSDAVVAPGAATWDHVRVAINSQ